MGSNQTAKLVFHVGGPAFHPVAEQARCVAEWLGQGFTREMREGADAFNDLSDCDLLVLMGLHWTGMDADWCGNLTYRPLNDHQKQSFVNYVASGRPILAHHGGIASYDDWPQFGQLLGFTWDWAITKHSPIGTYRVEVLPTGHPIVDGVSDYDLYDELYYDVQLTPGLAPTVHAQAHWEGRALPMVMSAKGGRIEGAGRTVYLANGHDMRAFACPALKHLWINSVRWLTHADS
jgi:uncharacterized protein